MTTVVFAGSGYIPPVLPPEQDWFGLQIIWEGWDGSRWDLTDRSSPVVALADGLVGLHFPAFEKSSSTSPGRAGRRSRGSRTVERSIELSVLLYSDRNSAEWLSLYKAFFDSFHPDLPGTLSVRTPGGVTRRILLTLESDGNHQFGLDPVKAGWAQFDLDLMADDPYWLGDPLPSYSWEQVVPVGFFDPPAPGLLFIMASSGFDAATMSNPGNVAGWPVWTIQAVTGSVSVRITVDGGPVQTPTITQGKTLVINTDPAIGSADLDGVDVDGLINPWDPREIPVGESVPVTIAMTGFGRVTGDLVPRHFRAFG